MLNNLTRLCIKVIPFVWPANVPTGFGCDSFNARRSQTKTRLSSEPLTINEFELSIKRTALTSLS
jgi:hypothetical protein